jgi:uncharacterized protein (TIGR02001 family)
MASGFLAAVSVFFDAQLATAQWQSNTTDAPEIKSSFEASMTAAIASDYNYRGYTLSDHNPSASATFEGTYGSAYADASGASVQMPNLSHFQMTDYAGVRPAFGSLTVDTGAEYYAYPGSKIDISYFEFYFLPTYAVTPNLKLGMSVNYAPDYSRTGAWENYNALTAKYAFDSGISLSGEIGRQRFGTTRAIADSPPIVLPGYTYWSFGVSYVYKSVMLDLHYFATNLSPQKCYLITGTGGPNIGSNGCRPAVVGSLSWALSDLKK